VADHAANLKAALQSAETYRPGDQKHGPRRTRSHEAIAELQIKIAERLEVLIAPDEGWTPNEN